MQYDGLDTIKEFSSHCALFHNNITDWICSRLHKNHKASPQAKPICKKRSTWKLSSCYI